MKVYVHVRIKTEISITFKRDYHDLVPHLITFGFAKSAFLPGYIQLHH